MNSVSDPKVKILFLASDPSDATRLRLGQELRDIREKLQLSEAIVVDEIVPGRKGGVRFRGTWWSARCTQNIALVPGTIVSVVGRREITLFVEPVQNES